MRTFTATWTDSHGNKYEQRMELADGDVTADLTYHEAWVRENHDVGIYMVRETTGMTTEKTERRIKRGVSNNYKVGSLLWVERNRSNDYRDMLYRLAYGDITREEAREELYALETDSASF